MYFYSISSKLCSTEFNSIISLRLRGVLKMNWIGKSLLDCTLIFIIITLATNFQKKQIRWLFVYVPENNTWLRGISATKNLQLQIGSKNKWQSSRSLRFWVYVRPDSTARNYCLLICSRNLFIFWKVSAANILSTRFVLKDHECN